MSEDRELVARLASNDESAIAWFVSQFRARVEAIARRYGVAAADCQDVWQNVVVDAFRQIRSGRFELKKSLASWVYSLAKGHSVNHLRKSRNRLVVPLETVALDVRSGSLPAHEKAMDSVLLVNEVLDRLRIPDRVVFVLKEQHGYTLQEIAQMLDVPIATVWDRLNRARDEFRRLVRPETGPESDD